MLLARVILSGAPAKVDSARITGAESKDPEDVCYTRQRQGIL
jgi:hypothetical protein